MHAAPALALLAFSVILWESRRLGRGGWVGRGTGQKLEREGPGACGARRRRRLLGLGAWATTCRKSAGRAGRSPAHSPPLNTPPAWSPPPRPQGLWPAAPGRRERAHKYISEN